MKWIGLWLCVALCAKPLDIEVNAKGAILMNAQTGAILFEKNSHLRLYPASTTKVATTLYALEQKELGLSEIVTVSAECLKGRSLKDRDHPYWLDQDGTMLGLKRGEQISLETLLYGMMLVSGNDAANVIAENLGGTIPQFMEKLNLYLQSLGCKNTQFSNPHGLTHPEHFSSAYDMAIMTRRALQITKFREIVSTLSYMKPKTNKQPAREIKLFNYLMKPGSRHYYSKAIGVKTGYTKAAQENLVAAAEQDGRTLIAVLLGCEPKTGVRYSDAKKMFEAAFAEKKERRRLMGPENIFSKVMKGSKLPLKAALTKGLSIEYFPAEEPNLKALIYWDDLNLPIQKGDRVGQVRILDENETILERGELVALAEVRGHFFLMMKEKVAKLFR